MALNINSKSKGSINLQDTQTVVGGNVRVRSSADYFDETYTPDDSPVTLPNVTHTDSDGSTVEWEAMKPFVATACATVSSLSVAVSSATPDYNGTVTITATPSGISPTSYTFLIACQSDGDAYVTQASNVLVWTVNRVGAIKISVTATDGVDTVGNVANITVTDPLNYAAKLVDWNGKQGVTVVNGKVDTIADQSGNGHDLPTWTINSQPFYETSSGKVISQSSRLQNTASNPLNGKSAFTIFFKACKFAAPNVNHRLIGFGSTGVQFTIGLVGDATRDVIIGEANFSRYIGFQADIINGNTVGFVKSGTNPYVAYVDGALAPIVVSSGTPQASLPTDNGIHLFTQNGSFNLNGMFDRIVIYDTDALTSTQITAINERIKQLHP